MADYNYAVIIGRLTADPELKQTQNGTSVVSFNVAVKRRAKAGNEADTDFIKCTAWRDRGEFVAKYFKKGSNILVSGEVQTNSFLDKNGTKRYETFINVVTTSFIDSKKNSEEKNVETSKADIYIEVNPNDDSLSF